MVPHRNLQKLIQTSVAPSTKSVVLLIIWLLLDYTYALCIPPQISQQNFYRLLTIKSIGIALCLIFLLCVRRTHWPQRYLSLYHYFVLLYCLPFTNTLFAFSYALDDTTVLLHVAFTAMILMFLVHWVIFIFLSLSGVTLAIVLREVLLGDDATMTIHKLQVIIQVYLYASIVSGMFARNQQNYFLNTAKTHRLLGSAIGHEARNVLNATLIFVQLVAKKLARETSHPAPHQTATDSFCIDAELYNLLHKTLPQTGVIAKQGIQAIKVLTQVLRDPTRLDRQKHPIRSIRTCTEVALEAYSFSEGEQEKLHVDLREDFEVQVSEIYQYVISNLLRNSYIHAKTAAIYLRLKDRKVYLKDEGIGIAPEDLPYIFDLFYTKGHQGTGIGLALCQYIMKAWGGKITCHSQQGNKAFTEFVLHFPPVRH